ncbi:MAG: FeoA family protein [Micromonosporaceae bacterium]
MDTPLLHRLHQAGVDPGATVTVEQAPNVVNVRRDGTTLQLTRDAASRVFIAAS